MNGESGNDALKNLRQSVNVLKAQMSYMRESTQKVEKAIEDVSIDLDAFIEVTCRPGESQRTT